MEKFWKFSKYISSLPPPAKILVLKDTVNMNRKWVCSHHSKDVRAECIPDDCSKERGPSSSNPGPDKLLSSRGTNPHSSWVLVCGPGWCGTGDSLASAPSLPGLHATTLLVLNNENETKQLAPSLLTFPALNYEQFHMWLCSKLQRRVSSCRSRSGHPLQTSQSSFIVRSHLLLKCFPTMPLSLKWQNNRFLFEQKGM